MALYRSSAGKAISAAKAMSANTGWVYAGVKAITDEISSMQFEVYQIDGNGEHTKIYDHEILDLLDAVNERQTGPEYKSMLGAHLELAGNGYIYLKGVKDETSKPDSMYLLNPGGIKIIYDKTQFPWVVVAYKFTIESREYTFKPYEIIHIKYPDPNDEYEGLGTVQAIPAWIDLHNAAVEFNRQYFVRGTKIGQMFTTDASDEAALERLRDSYEEAHAGVENSHRPLILPKGVAPTGNGQTAKEMDFGAMFDRGRDMILGGLRTGKTILGTAESDTNRATAETADYVFAKRTIKPKMRFIVAALNNFLVPRFADDIYLSFLDPTPEDKSFRITEMQAASGSQPILSVNETRKTYMGLGPIENGDTVMMANNLIPVGKPAESTEPAVPNTGINKSNYGKGKKKKKDEPTERVPISRYAKNHKFRSKLSSELKESIMKHLKEVQETPIWQLSKADYMIIWQKFVDRVTIKENELREGLIKINAEQKAEVLRNIKPLFKDSEKGITQKISPSDIFDVKKWMGIITDFATPLALSIARIESEAAANAFGKPGIDITENVDAAKSLEESMALMAQSYTETTVDQLKTAIAQGLKENSGYANTAELIQGVYEFADTTRATAVARTETFRVANYSTKATWKQIGVQTIQWYTAEDSDVCIYCEQMDGKIISVDDNFFNQGDSLTVGDSTLNLDYSDVGAPPLHTNCRCFQRPQDIGSLQ